ncbi:MAG: high-affinity nickel-transport family protein [Myxococcota bacterium]
MLTAILLGFGLGLRHAFDPDHTVAVSAIAARHRNPWVASWIGVSWGIGHGATLLLVGLAVIALGVVIPEALAEWLELCVGVALMGLGAVNVLAAAESVEQTGGEPALRSALARSGLVGLLHGLAGSGAVALLAVTSMPDPAAAVAYLAVFGAGTIGGMVAFSCALGVPFARIGAAGAARRWVSVGTGTLSLLVGAYLVCAMIYAQGILPLVS